MKTKPHPGAGVEIWDVDLRRVDDATFAAIRALFVEHGLVFFRDQELREEDHIAFAARFGAINVNRFFPRHPEHPEIAVVSKRPEQRINVGGGWHTDHSYDTEPALGSILVARELPRRGGDTWFVSMYDAFERLPERVKERLRRMRAVHSAKHIFGSRTTRIRRFLGAGELAHNPELADALDDVIALVPRMRGVLAREGRDFAGFDVLAMCPDASDEASLLLLAEGGVDEIELWPWNRYGVGLDDLPGKLDAVARYADEVIAPVRSVLGG